MPGSISVPSSGSFENKEIIGSRLGLANKKKKKKINQMVSWWKQEN
jgi:hypothetical protein